MMHCVTRADFIHKYKQTSYLQTICKVYSLKRDKKGSEPSKHWFHTVFNWELFCLALFHH